MNELLREQIETQGFLHVEKCSDLAASDVWL